MRRLALCVLLLTIVPIGCRQAQPTVTYSVAVYDPARDPAADLAAAVELARATDKRILLQVGGDWCKWCHRLDDYVAAQPAVATAIGKNFIIMKVNSSDENRNEEFLSHYSKVLGYPHWFVLDRDGKLVHSQGTADLEAGDSYSQPALLQFVDQWKS
jgi:thioredoxin-related protein